MAVAFATTAAKKISVLATCRDAPARCRTATLRIRRVAETAMLGEQGVLADVVWQQDIIMFSNGSNTSGMRSICWIAK